MSTLGTLCSGGEGVGVGARLAGLTHLWGIEYDDDIAQVARANGFHTLTADVTQVDPADFAPVDVLHASPPCPSFSVAKTGGEETAEDVAIAAAVCRFIRVLLPRVFTLENVYGYRKSESWAMIARVLTECGYRFNYWHLCAADYGVPQTRRRMVVIARRDGVTPTCPEATHAPAEEITPMFDDRLPWVGWYEAIADLIPTLPDSEFAPWQLARLPSKLRTMLVPGSNGSNGVLRWDDEPSVTIGDTERVGNMPRAYIVSNAATERTDGIIDGDDPALTVTDQSNGRLRAFILDAKNSRPERPGRVDHTTGRLEDEPMWALQSETGPGHVRAFVVDGKLSTSGDDKALQTHDEGEPYGTVVTSVPAWRDTRSFIVESKNANQEYGDGIRDDGEPAFTVVTDHKLSHQPTAVVVGRVVKMTPRCLARFQSFPDWYVLPDSNTLACRVIGNAVPPLLAKAIFESVKEGQ